MNNGWFISPSKTLRWLLWGFISWIVMIVILLILASCDPVTTPTHSPLPTPTIDSPLPTETIPSPEEPTFTPTSFNTPLTCDMPAATLFPSIGTCTPTPQP